MAKHSEFHIPKVRPEARIGRSNTVRMPTTLGNIGASESVMRSSGT
nr:MAG TPA: hypothetical protein [Caudoviricetes sp.]